MRRKVAADYYKSFYLNFVDEKASGSKMAFSIFSNLIRSTKFKYSELIFPLSALSFSFQKKDAAPIGAKKNLYSTLK